MRKAFFFWLCVLLVTAIAENLQARSAEHANRTEVVDDASPDARLAADLARELAAACPVVDPSSARERDTSASKLAASELLRGVSENPLFWGGQSAEGAGFEESNTTRLDPLVWRRLYLSLFMFPGDFTIEPRGDAIVLHLPCRFRNQLFMGAYPYPFWHSEAKWESYQRSTEVLLFVRDGRLLGGMRSAQKDPTRPIVAHRWNGQWRWSDASSRRQPFVTLYDYLFSPSNPYASEVDAAYRAFETEARQSNCMACHSPNNAAQVRSLELISYPNQALGARHRIVRAIEEGRMPPGATDPAQRARLAELARALADAGDRALAYEGETVGGGR